MLPEKEIKNILAHCEKTNDRYETWNMSGDEGIPYFEFQRNQGWCEALRLVLKLNHKKEEEPNE